MNRREFLRISAMAAASVGFPYYVPKRVLGADGRSSSNDKMRVGFIGAGGRARHLMTAERLADHGTIVAIADCCRPKAEQAAKSLPNAEQIKVYGDYRQLLEREKLDVVFVPTTTHARALICIHAMQAGLDVYAEKPLTLTVAEGRVLAKAVKKYKRVLQVGTQQRSIPINAWASKLVREGGIGKVKEVQVCNFEGPVAWTPQPAQPMPEGLDWDQWCNQTELRPYHGQLQNRWSIWWDYDGGGQSWGVSGWGTHSLDQVQCALGTDDTGPVEITLEGNPPASMPTDLAAAARLPKVTMRYANGTVLKLANPKRQPQLDDLGAIFVGEKGTLEIKRGSCVASSPELLKGAPPDTAQGPLEAADHLANFFECVRTRAIPNAGVETAHRATTVCHLVNISREVGGTLKWDPVAERFTNNDAANKLLSRPRRKGYELPTDLA